uniref:Serine racemase n=1 Tax=Panagrellus redivivus TaxID=6233 RepID=A0A7E4ZTI9_PANRE
MSALTAVAIDAAAQRIAGVVHRTPVMTSESLDRLLADRIPKGSKPAPKLYFKCENFQKAGSFKARGAANAVAKTLATSDVSGFVTHSSGNHGQALAFAAARFNKPCTVVVPSNAPKAKVSAIAAYGAEIVSVEPTITARKGTCHELAEKRNLAIVDPHDDWDVMEGQGTIAIEMFEQIDGLDAVVLAVGGGGLLGGVAQWFSERHPEVAVFAVEPEGKDLRKSVKAGTRLWDSGAPVDTIADGIRVLPIGEKCFEVVKTLPESAVLTVNDSDIASAWRLIHERLKLVIEPTGAVPLAAVLKYSDVFANFSNIGLVLCGGNVDFVDPLRSK